MATYTWLFMRERKRANSLCDSSYAPINFENPQSHDSSDNYTKSKGQKILNLVHGPMKIVASFSSNKFLS